MPASPIVREAGQRAQMTLLAARSLIPKHAVAAAKLSSPQSQSCMALTNPALQEQSGL